MNIRYAKKEDEHYLLEWRNDPITRQNSFSQEVIAPQAHTKWFSESLKNSKRVILIGVVDEPIGMVRFDRLPQKNEAIISIVVSSKHRGKGYGIQLLTKACDFFFSHYLQNKIIAHIKSDNTASLHLFQKAGFSIFKTGAKMILMRSHLSIGLKLWSKNTELFAEAITTINEGIAHYLELTYFPGTLDKLAPLKGLPIVIHSVSSSQGICYSDGNVSQNDAVIRETIQAANFLASDVIIIHPDVGTEDNLISFLQRNPDSRIIVENMPKKAIGGGILLGCTPEEMVRITAKKVGFCLDFAHAYKSALSQNIDPKQLINEFLKLDPLMYHLCDGTLTKEEDEHLDLGSGMYDLSWCKEIITKKNGLVTLEVPKSDGLKNDIKNISFFRDL